MNEGDAVDAMIERMAREEQDDIDRKQGQFILDLATAKGRGEDPLADLLRRAHQAEAEADRR